MAKPYWRRLWILQEILLVRTIYVVCENHMIPSPDFIDLIRIFQRWHPLYLALGRHHVGRKLISNSHELEIDFHRLILDFSDNQCHDPRDKIYGLRGLSKLWQRGHIIVDYSKTVEEVYIDGIILILAEWGIRKQLWPDLFPFRKACELLGHNMKSLREDQLLKRLQKDMAVLSWNE
jgi:hypothetical protein